MCAIIHDLMLMRALVLFVYLCLLPVRLNWGEPIHDDCMSINQFIKIVAVEVHMHKTFYVVVG